MNYEHESDDLKAEKRGPYTCKHCGQKDFNPIGGTVCPEKVVQEIARRFRLEE